MTELLERDPPGLNNAAWQAMHQALQYAIRRLGEYQDEADSAAERRSKALERIEECKKERRELIEAMNALRLAHEQTPYVKC